jgi:hypothetical protein
VSGPGLETGSEDFAQWAESFSSRHVTGIHAGLVVLRRREGPNWIRYQPVIRPVAGPAADTVRQCLAGGDFVDARVSDEELRRLVLRPCPGLRVEQVREYRGERWPAASVRAYLTGGLALETKLDPAAAMLLNQFDGLRTVRDCLDRLAEFMDTEPVKIADSALDTTRLLVSSGLLMSER